MSISVDRDTMEDDEEEQPSEFYAVLHLTWDEVGDDLDFSFECMYSSFCTNIRLGC